MFPPSSTAYLQTGFRTPEIYTVVMVSALGLGAKAKEANVVAFYFVTAGVVGVGTLCWVIVASSAPAKHYFSLKDETCECGECRCCCCCRCRCCCCLDYLGFLCA